MFSLGLLKKVLLADTFAKAFNWGYENFMTMTGMDCLLMMLFNMFQLYFDFSGYSDMAVGISAMFNITLPINFDSPYKALSIRDCWKRWHISLTQFFTRYIYIPLGGSRKGKAFTYLNIMIVFVVSGMWHGVGWNYILWGGLNGILSCFDRSVERLENRIWKPVRWLFTFTAISILWMLFSSGSIGIWIEILRRVAHISDIAISSKLAEIFVFSEEKLLFSLLGMSQFTAQIPNFSLLLFVGVALFICLVPENNYRNRKCFRPWTPVFAALCLVWGVLYLGGDTSFVYFGF